MTDRTAAMEARSWPFEEARKLLSRIGSGGKREILFETGYGPSGLPHIGTFAEVVRTSMVRNAFRVLTDDRVPTRLVCFSDDLDALRSVPDNVPDREAMKAAIGLPLTSVPDPFGEGHPSFGAGNNTRLRGFLDQFGFDYEFASASDWYRSGRFDATLLRMLALHDEVRDVILPTLGAERRATYSPFLPISPTTGRVLQAVVTGTDPARGTIEYVDPETGRRVETTVTGGAVKCQWKADWALRWATLGVDYEMAGKDLIDSTLLSGRICRVLGAAPPEGFNYELFLDEKGQKISKSKGNGLSVDEWLEYGTRDSLVHYMFGKPRSARKLHVEAVPRAVDEHRAALLSLPGQDGPQRLDNPAWHVHAGGPFPKPSAIPYSMLLNLVSASNAADPETVWGFVGRQIPGLGPDADPALDTLVAKAIRYHAEVGLPRKVFRDADGTEREALAVLSEMLGDVPPGAGEEEIHTVVLEAGRRFGRYRDETKPAPDGRPGVKGEWFQVLYQVLLGEERGPRFGPFVAVFGIEETRELIAGALARNAEEFEPETDSAPAP